MPVADQTYSFRAPREFAQRLDRTRRALAHLSGEQGRGVEPWLVAEFEMALLRRLPEVADSGSQGAFVRAVMEAVVSATEKVERELERMDAYAAFADQDTEGEDLRRAALAQTASFWE
jgi:hypothetical protein